MDYNGFLIKQRELRTVGEHTLSLRGEVINLWFLCSCGWEGDTFSIFTRKSRASEISKVAVNHLREVESASN